MLNVVDGCLKWQLTTTTQLQLRLLQLTNGGSSNNNNDDDNNQNNNNNQVMLKKQSLNLLSSKDSGVQWYDNNENDMLKNWQVCSLIDWLSKA